MPFVHYDKKILRQCLIVVVIFSCVPLRVTGQEPSSTERIYIFSAMAKSVIPFQPMRNKTDKWGWGLEAEIGMQISSKLPVFASLSVAYHLFDSETTNYLIQDNELEYDVEHRLTTNMVEGLISLRFQPDINFIFYPFFKISAGLHTFYTYSRINETETDDNYDRYTDLGDWSFVYGLSGGVDIYLTETIYLILGADYIKGSRIELNTRIAENEVIDPIENFETRTAPISIFSPKVGVEIFF